MDLDDELKEMLKELGSALHHALVSDDHVKQVTEKIRSRGYDLYLIMEANIALDKRNDQQEGQLYLHHPPHDEEEIKLQFNQFDAEFLSELKIKTDES